MKRMTVTIDNDDLEEIVREHVAAAFPGFFIEPATFPYFSSVTLRLRRTKSADEEAEEIEAPPDMAAFLTGEPIPKSEPEDMPF